MSTSTICSTHDGSHCASAVNHFGDRAEIEEREQPGEGNRVEPHSGCCTGARTVQRIESRTSMRDALTHAGHHAAAAIAVANQPARHAEGSRARSHGSAAFDERALELRHRLDGPFRRVPGQRVVIVSYASPS